MVKFFLLFLISFTTLTGQPDSLSLDDSSLVAVISDSVQLQIKADSVRTDSIEVDEKTVPLLQPFRTKAFYPGEKLTFKIRYGFIKAGEATMAVRDTIQKNGYTAYHIQTTAKSVKAFDWIFEVRDVVNAFVRYSDFAPLRFEKKLREGSYFADQFVDYSVEDSLAKIEFIRYDEDDQNKVRKQKRSEVKIPPQIHDILSSFYYIRNGEMKVGQSIFLYSLESDKVYDLEIKVYRKEKVDTDAGLFRCFVVEPLLRGEGIFKQKGRLLIWLTDDHLRIPVQMTSKVLVGHITTELIKIEGIKEKIPARIGD